MEIALCLLTRNELLCCQQIFPKIPQPCEAEGFTSICVIDGGSTDGTVEFFKERNIPVISQINIGRGAAYLEAFQNIQADVYVFFSPDGNEDIADIKKFREHFKNGADVVIASRMMKESVNEEDNQLFRWRKWANLLFSLIANKAFRKKSSPYITDSLNGLRGLTKKAMDQLKLTALDYTIEYQMTIRAMKQNLNIVEFPTIEGQRIAGVTGAPSIPTGIKHIKLLVSELQANELVVSGAKKAATK